MLIVGIYLEYWNLKLCFDFIVKVIDLGEFKEGRGDEREEGRKRENYDERREN